MVLETLRVASPKAKVLNLTFVLLNFLAWVACCVCFGGAMLTWTYKVMGGTITGNFHWNYIEYDKTGDQMSFTSVACDSSIFRTVCDKCTSGGRGLTALMVFAFLGLTPVLGMSTLRILGVSVGPLEPTRKSLLLEYGLTLVNTLWFFLAVCTYGGTCWHAATHDTNIHVTGTGFAYLICCFFFLLGNCVVAFMLRADASTHLGSGSSGSDYQSETGGDATTTNYNPPAGYQYNGADASQAYASSYHTDVVPAAGSENNL